jgi:hypothetical protein
MNSRGQSARPYRFPMTGAIMLWDRSSAPARDGPGGANHQTPQASNLPAHQPPTTCACGAKGR